jgi:aspartate/methionine/tyrosine aminotransferase
MIMDDMAYEGLELVDKKPYSFGQLDIGVAQSTVTFKGVSKIGIPGVRIGMAIGHYEVIEAIAENQLITEFCANSLGVDLLTARYGQSEVREDFVRHQERLREAHQEKYNFVKVFFRGLDNVEALTDTQRYKLIVQYSRYAEIPEAEAEERLQRGLPNFAIPDELECGFFLPIYCENLRDKSITVKFIDNGGVNMPQSRFINHGDMVYWAFKSFGIKTIPSSWQGMPDRSMMARMTLSMPEADFYKFYDRMNEMHEYFWGEEPEVQPDLFREKSKEAIFAPKMG